MTLLLIYLEFNIGYHRVNFHNDLECAFKSIFKFRVALAFLKTEAQV